jgi:hypothetical protein
MIMACIGRNSDGYPALSWEIRVTQRRKAVFCAVRNFRICVVTLKLGLNSGVRNIEFT